MVLKSKLQNKEKENKLKPVLKCVSLKFKNNTNLEISLNVVNISKDSSKTKPNIIENLVISLVGFERNIYSYINKSNVTTV